jgi:hypothetical protein
LEHSVSATKDNEIRKVIGIDNIKVEIVLEIKYFNPDKGFNLNAITYAQEKVVVGDNGYLSTISNNDIWQFRNYITTKSIFAISYEKDMYQLTYTIEVLFYGKV